MKERAPTSASSIPIFSLELSALNRKNGTKSKALAMATVMMNVYPIVAAIYATCLFICFQLCCIQPPAEVIRFHLVWAQAAEGKWGREKCLTWNSRIHIIESNDIIRSEDTVPNQANHTAYAMECEDIKRVVNTQKIFHYKDYRSLVSISAMLFRGG